LVPVIIKALAGATGVYTYNEQSRKAVTGYYVFLVVNIFFVSVVAGSVLDEINLIQNASSQ